LGHGPVQRWNLPDGRVISRTPVRPALVSEADFIAAQGISTARDPASGMGLTAPQKRWYLLAGLLRRPGPGGMCILTAPAARRPWTGAGHEGGGHLAI
jgi:hypothetical protein